MQTYSQFAPTTFDTRGAFLPERQDWFVLPVSRTRDSGPLDESNFQTALAMLGGESDSVEVHRFGHWGPGWFEIILVNPQDATALATAERIETSLEDYPVLDESDFSSREWEDYLTGWNSYGRGDFVTKLRHDFDLTESVKWFLDAVDADTMREFFESGVRSGEYYVGQSDGVSINVRSFDCSRQELAAFIRKCRSQVPA